MEATTVIPQEPATKSGASLYIIIAIIVIVILLCVLFYVCKWCKKKELTPTDQDPEAGKPLVETKPAQLNKNEKDEQSSDGDNSSIDKPKSDNNGKHF